VAKGTLRNVRLLELVSPGIPIAISGKRERRKGEAMKRMLALLVLVALTGSSGCTVITTAVKDTAEARSWREDPTWEGFTQQINDAAKRGWQRGHDSEFQRKVKCEAKWTMAILGALAGAPNFLDIVSSECLPNIDRQVLSGAADIPQEPRLAEGPEDR
jgi:hypothetical protein